MADLRDRETMVGPKNDSKMGPSGTRARSRDSLYMLVGGSSDVYDVTVNFETKNGHWCQTEAGKRCHGNGNGKGQKYGPPQQRDKHNPIEWCKHVQAALADVEGLAEAAERTAIAFGGAPRKVEPTPEPVTVTVKPPVPAFGGESAADRLSKLEGEAETLREQIRAEEGAELRESLSALMGKFGIERVEEMVREMA
jgi:hypothetical protein